jgi:hypothetical protein
MKVLAYLSLLVLPCAGFADPVYRLVMARPSYALGGLQLDRVTVLGLEVSAAGVKLQVPHTIEAGNVITSDSPMVKGKAVHPYVAHRGKDVTYVVINRQSKNSTERVKERATIESIRYEIRSIHPVLSDPDESAAVKTRWEARLETLRDLLDDARKREQELNADFGLTEMVRLKPFDRRAAPDSVYFPWRHISSILEVRNRLLLGMPGRIEYITLDRPYRKPFVLYESPVGSHGKAIDAMARCEDMLIAIDDVKSPKFAHAFALDNFTSFPEYRYSMQLPFQRNSQYREAASSEDSLALLATFSGQGLRGEAVEFYTATSKGLDHVASSEETKDDAGRREGRVLAGIRQTSLSGLVCMGNTVLAAARERGVLVIPHDDTEAPSARYLKGICTDVTRQGSQIFALVQIGGATTLVALELRNGGLLEVYRHRIGTKMTEFID